MSLFDELANFKRELQAMNRKLDTVIDELQAGNRKLDQEFELLKMMVKLQTEDDDEAE